jgi:hypothetical protein
MLSVACEINGYIDIPLDWPGQDMVNLASLDLLIASITALTTCDVK